MTIDIFSAARAQSGEFFRWVNVGDQVQGTYVDTTRGIDSYGNDQVIYVLVAADGKVWNAGIRTTSVNLINSMNGVRFGQIIGFRLDEIRPSKVAGRSPAKIIRLYADPKFVDQTWIDQNKTADARAPMRIPGDGAWDEEDAASDLDTFVAPTHLVPPPSSLPHADENPQNEAIAAIRNLAKTKGLTNDSMSLEEADHTIEQYTLLPLTEENLTKIIIKLTGYVGQ